MCFGNATRIQDAVLSINRDELQALLAEDRRFRRVNIELALPGEKCRIFRVADVMEPRAKMGTGGEDFLHPSTGQSKTCALKGAAMADIEKAVKSEGALPLYMDGDRLIGCCQRGHEQDFNLIPEIMIENFTNRATGVMALRHMSTGGEKRYLLNKRVNVAIPDFFTPWIRLKG
jgi:hypothetical protein